MREGVLSQSFLIKRGLSGGALRRRDRRLSDRYIVLSTKRATTWDRRRERERETFADVARNRRETDGREGGCGEMVLGFYGFKLAKGRVVAAIINWRVRGNRLTRWLFEWNQLRHRYDDAPSVHSTYRTFVAKSVESEYTHIYIVQRVQRRNV